MTKVISILLTASTLVAVAACDKGADVKPTPETQNARAADAKPEAKITATPTTAVTMEKVAGQAVAAQPATVTQVAITNPQQQTYPLNVVKTVADDCASAKVLLATAPKSVGADYAWNVTRQAMLANQQFRVVQGAPSVPGEVQIVPYGYTDGAFALVASCKDGGTCNRLAAMYKAIVRSSHPQVVCGAPIQGITSPVGTFRWDTDPQGNLPQSGELQALCARLNACTIATDQSTAGDPFLECQKAPSKFKTDCAKKYPCADVLACAGQ